MPNLWVSCQLGVGSQLQRAAGGELDPFLSLLLLKKFLSATKEHTKTPNQLMQQMKCPEHLGSKAEKANFWLDYSRFSGNIVQVFKCNHQQLPLLLTKGYFKDIPVQHKKWGFAASALDQPPHKC